MFFRSAADEAAAAAAAAEAWPNDERQRRDGRFGRDGRSVNVAVQLVVAVVVAVSESFGVQDGSPARHLRHVRVPLHQQEPVAMPARRPLVQRQGRVRQPFRRAAIMFQ